MSKIAQQNRSRSQSDRKHLKGETDDQIDSNLEILQLCKELEDLGEIKSFQFCSGKSWLLYQYILSKFAEDLFTSDDKENKKQIIISAFEITFNKQSNVEKKSNLIIPPQLDQSLKNKTPATRIRVQNIEQFEYAIQHIQRNSMNFDENGNPQSNQSHLFIKIHIHQDGRVQTLSIVDMAGLPLKDKQVYFERNEINASNNYLHYIMKQMSYHSNIIGGNNVKNPQLNKNSKIFKELDSILNGNSKINLLYIKTDEVDEECHLKCDKFIQKLHNIRVPLIKQKKQKTNQLNYIECHKLIEEFEKQKQCQEIKQTQLQQSIVNNRKKWEKTKKEIQNKQTPVKTQPKILHKFEPVEEKPEEPLQKLPSPAKKTIDLTCIMREQPVVSEHSFARDMQIQDQQNYFQRFEQPTILITQNTQDHNDEATIKKSMLKSEISEIMKLIENNNQAPAQESFKINNNNSFIKIQENSMTQYQFGKIQAKVNDVDEQVHMIMIRADQILGSQLKQDKNEISNLIKHIDLVQNELHIIVEEACNSGQFQTFKQQFQELDQILAEIKDQLININMTLIINQSTNQMKKGQREDYSRSIDYGIIQKNLISIHEKFYLKLESLVNTVEGSKLALSKASSSQLQKIESQINILSDLLVVDNFNRNAIDQVTDMMNNLYDDLVQIFGKSDSDIRQINKMLRDAIVEQSSVI
ncbi:UNKNOWN [Stylonychia lemnae]|uniref:Kinesin motor domain-containing protein n=1 Tax=Stylonychia lemnae TaxID=5949 RepID=A0A078AFT6_STYLE|nr:UNKNOWN [Stylonychia lemnae]|eukprot:CDW79753.1 UNKNOWN [Stylonychia lemnae]